MGREGMRVLYGPAEPPAGPDLRYRGCARNLRRYETLVGTITFMAVAFLDFEQPIAELEAKIEELRHVTSESEVNIKDEISRLQAKSRQLTRTIFANLTPWQITQLARHPQRPYPLDYTSMILTEFHELHGDRMYADDMAIVGGLGRLENRVVMLIGHQKGRDTKERVRRNYGMPKPEGYRKALRLMKMAERFELPIITFIDTQAPTRASVPKSAARARPSRAICLRCRCWPRPSSPS